MASDAGKLVSEIRSALKPLDEQILQHPYIDAVESGKITRECLAGFAGHQYHIVGSDMILVAAMLACHGTHPGRSFLMNLLHGESAAFEACLVFARVFGLDEAALTAYKPQPGGHAYAAYVSWLACYGSDAELAAAFLVNFAAWGAKMRTYGGCPQGTIWFQKPRIGILRFVFRAPAVVRRSGSRSDRERIGPWGRSPLDETRSASPARL